MERFSQADIKRVQELLSRTGEFIAYFELAETKMMQWRLDIEEENKKQHEHIDAKLIELKAQVDNMQTLFDSAGMARFRLMAESQQEQAEVHLATLKSTGDAMIENLNQQGAHLEALIQQIHLHINNTTTDALIRLDTHLSKYDANQFHRLANESCEYVNNFTQKNLLQSQKLLKTFQWRQALFAFIITMFTSITVGLYMNDELPWEHHQTASIERNAGKLLMYAWPHLTANEQEKIQGRHEPVDS